MNSFVRTTLLAVALLATPFASMAQDNPIATLMGHKSLGENLRDVPYAEEVLRKEANIIGRHGPLEVTLIFTSMGQQLGRGLEARGQPALGARVFNFSTTTENRVIERLTELEEEDKANAARDKALEEAKANGTAPNSFTNPLPNLG